jgi:hypothetical protein
MKEHFLDGMVFPVKKPVQNGSRMGAVYWQIYVDLYIYTRAGKNRQIRKKLAAYTRAFVTVSKNGTDSN